MRTSFTSSYHPKNKRIYPMMSIKKLLRSRLSSCKVADAPWTQKSQKKSPQTSS